MFFFRFLTALCQVSAEERQERQALAGSENDGRMTGFVEDHIKFVNFYITILYDPFYIHDPFLSYLINTKQQNIL